MDFIVSFEFVWNEFEYFDELTDFRVTWRVKD